MPLLWLSFAFVIGIALAEISGLPAYIWMILFALGIAIIMGEKFLLHSSASWKKIRRVIPVYPGLLLLLLGLGGVRHLAGQPVTSENSLARYNDRGS
jgi:hypothetical protein